MEMAEIPSELLTPRDSQCDPTRLNLEHLEAAPAIQGSLTADRLE